VTLDSATPRDMVHAAVTVSDFVDGTIFAAESASTNPSSNGRLEQLKRGTPDADCPILPNVGGGVQCAAFQLRGGKKPGVGNLQINRALSF
jgi:hypothetical protein